VSETFGVQRAGAADLALARQAIVEVDERELEDEAALVRFLSDPSCYLLLCVEGGRVVGCLNGYSLWRPHRSGPQFLLYEIGVRPECRSRGIGSALVKAFLAEARAANAFEVWVVTSKSNAAAMRMYCRNQFRAEADDDTVLNLLFDRGR